jgi:hypothetical protein
MHLHLRRIESFGFTLGALLLVAHCGGSDLTLPGGAGPASITKQFGDNQNGAAGRELERPLIVKVVDSRGTGVPGQRVVFSLDAELPGAAVNPGEDRTKTDGTATARWVLGATSGSQSLTARVVGDGVPDGIAATFNASAGANAAQAIRSESGDDQSGPVGVELGGPLVVLVTDEFGNPVANVPVNWDADDGSVDPASSTTGSDGRAETSWVLGSSIGSQTATASSGELNGSPVTFTATAGPGSAARLVLVSGNGQSAAPGQELSAPLVVRLEDGRGNGIPDRAVSWVIGAGGGSVASPTSNTDGNGEARARWSLGSGTGPNTLNAVVSGVGVIGFSATAGGGGGGGGGGPTPSRLQFLVQPSDADRKERISPAVQVAVLDQNGDRVTGAQLEIKLELTGHDNGHLKGHTSETTRSGVAIFDDIEVDEAGDYRLHATSDGLPPVDSDAFQIHGRHHGHGDD